MLLLMQITGAREMKIQTVGFVRFELGLGIFMKVVERITVGAFQATSYPTKSDWILVILD